MSIDIFDSKQIQELELLDVVTGREDILIDDGTFTKRTKVSNILGHIVNELNTIDRDTVIRLIEEAKQEVLQEMKDTLKANTDQINKDMSDQFKEVNDKLVPSELGTKVYPINGTITTSVESYNPATNLGGEWSLLGRMNALINVSGTQIDTPLYVWKRTK